ncbi:hypothetical protein F5Y15DRAFT_431006 [Xylariaceae sp. FL0016]|nr:hypothetical protein F5Y15DRAFT_431006 [Xylariaceae sp. FL0016]
MDGISVQILLNDLEKVYKGQAPGPLPLQMTAFSRTQREDYESGKMNTKLGFWKTIFSEPPPVLPLLPIAKVSTRPPMHSFDVFQIHRRLDPTLVSLVKQTSKAQRSTPFHLYLAVFKAMLFKFTDAQDLTIGIADAHRSDEAMRTIGLLINILVLRFRRMPDQSFSDAISEARNTAYAALSSGVLFDLVLEELNIPRSSQHSPIFQAFFDYRQGTQDKQAFDDCLFEMEEALPGRTAYDITLDLLLDTYIGLLEALSRDVSSPWDRVHLFKPTKLTSALDLGCGPTMESSWPKTIPHRIDQVAKMSSNQDKIAVRDGVGSVLAYADLANRVEAIAEALIRAGAGDGSRILVFQQATADWVCSMLAIMRIGAIYVPLDMRNPLPRLTVIAQDCQPSCILADITTAHDASKMTATAKVVNVNNVGAKSTSHQSIRAREESTAAILYTSGSTGTPKGILVKHSVLRNQSEGYTRTYNLGAEHVLQQSAFTFNHSSDQIFTGLVNGGMAYVVPYSKRGDPLEITNIIRRYDITYTKATPSEYAMWLQFGAENLQHASNWRFAFGGGETLTSTTLRDLEALGLPELRFFNSYGPTEISISSHKMEVAYRDRVDDESIPCGYSLPNYMTYILDEQLQPLPPGVPGEVFIGGAGVSQGYLNNDELNAEAFVADPYAARHPGFVTNGWTRMYRTGDIGHLTKDGALVFHRRVKGDTQVKIRGVRIELNDVESNILATADGVLREAIVTLRAEDFLVVHVIFSPQHNCADKERFLANLLSRLPMPQYMVPAMAIPLERLPLSNHSKVDRKAVEDLPLPAQEPTAGNSKRVELNETTLQLGQIWEDVLGRRFNIAIDPSSSFFAVGGNSLLIVRLQARIRSVFNVVIRVVELMGANTMGEMARRIEESSVVQTLDWDKETEITELDIPRPDASCETRPVARENRTVLLTGATGFLAKHLLPRLTKDPSISKVYCIAVRDKDKQVAAERVPADSKIITYEGDLSLPRLGLSETAFAALAGEVDVILHMGAARSFWDSYHVLRRTNVTATQELVRLATARRVPIHYTSSAATTPDASYVPPSDGSDGYVASKWASDRVLDRAAETLGLPVTIHRFVPGPDPGSSEQRDAVLAELVRFAHARRSVPDFEGLDGRIDMIPGTSAADALLEVVLQRETMGGAAGHVEHVCDLALGVADVKKHLLEHVKQTDYETLPAIRWAGRIKELGFAHFLASQDVVFRRKGGSLVSKR